MVAAVLGLLYSHKPAIKYNAAVVINYTDDYKIIYGENEEIEIPGKNSRKIIFKQMEMEMARDKYSHGQVDIIMEYKIGNKVEYYFDPANERAENVYLWINNLLGQKDNKLTSNIINLDQPGNRYIDYLIPGLIALGIMNATLWGIGWTLIEFRIKKFLRRMVATPMRKTDFMLAISITRFSLSLIEAGLLYTFARYVFDVEMKGSIFSFGVLFLAGHISFSGLSVLLASRTNNTRVGNGLINITTMPMFLLSGVFFSYHSFPDWLINFIKYIPLTILADSMRNVFLFGGDILSNSFSIMYLVTFGLITYLIGLKIYRWY
jgi:ABC-type multidrug transport system permease subunit